MENVIEADDGWTLVNKVLTEQSGLYAKIVRNNCAAFEQMISEDPNGKVLLITTGSGSDEIASIVAITEQCGCLDVHFCLELEPVNARSVIFSPTVLVAVREYAQSLKIGYVIFTVPKRPHFTRLNNACGMLAVGNQTRELASGQEMKSYCLNTSDILRIC